MTKAKLIAACVAVALLSGCARPPAGPTVAVTPGPYKPPEVFVQEQAACMQYGSQMAARSGQEASQQQRYDLAYGQCMYAKGNQVPGFAAPTTSPPPPPPG
jgi:hypothetical protein